MDERTRPASQQKGRDRLRSEERLVEDGVGGRRRRAYPHDSQELGASRHDERRSHDDRSKHENVELGLKIRFVKRKTAGASPARATADAWVLASAAIASTAPTATICSQIAALFAAVGTSAPWKYQWPGLTFQKRCSGRYTNDSAVTVRAFCVE